MIKAFIDHQNADCRYVKLVADEPGWEVPIAPATSGYASILPPEVAETFERRWLKPCAVLRAN
jgi:hypothetical protein